MLNEMPGKIIKKYDEGDELLLNLNIDDLFGFFEVEVTAPKQLIYPLLISKSDGLTIHPLGKFVGTYFSEELKAVQAQGYKIKLISGYEFSKVNIFSEYINHFYSIKKISKGAERFISKLHLNTLYGYFGRSLAGLETVIYEIYKL
jgi:hypothetical protein